MDTIKEMIELDAEIYAMVDRNPKLAEVYRYLMGEELGAAVILPRMPTADDWSAAERLAKSRQR